jgi:hypothetical protein
MTIGEQMAEIERVTQRAIDDAAAQRNGINNEEQNKVVTIIVHKRVVS